MKRPTYVKGPIVLTYTIRMKDGLEATIQIRSKKSVDPALAAMLLAHAGLYVPPCEIASVEVEPIGAYEQVPA